MIAALLPVKTFTRSKERLAGFLTPAERAALARTMFEDVLAALREALSAGSPTPGVPSTFPCAGVVAGAAPVGMESIGQGLDCLLVATAEPYVLSRCRDLHIPCLEESEQRSHSDSVDLATGWAMNLGATSLLSLPIDTPAVTGAEILALLELHRRFPVVIVPSADGRGTNALLRTPPDAIRPHFGPESCRLHVQEAESKGLSCLVFPSPGLGSDIDTPEDLQDFALTQKPCRTVTLARQMLATNRGVPACR